MTISKLSCDVIVDDFVVHNRLNPMQLTQKNKQQFKNQFTVHNCCRTESHQGHTQPSNQLIWEKTACLHRTCFLCRPGLLGGVKTQLFIIHCFRLQSKYVTSVSQHLLPNKRMVVILLQLDSTTNEHEKYEFSYRRIVSLMPTDDGFRTHKIAS